MDQVCCTASSEAATMGLVAMAYCRAGSSANGVAMITYEPGWQASSWQACDSSSGFFPQSPTQATFTCSEVSVRS